ncbi:MAG: efflux RND transporter periplasmic adaptor subunit, partial [Mangrovimonas sp.]|nr:efflux RND transporter periplasmic adaptor subunit [Mangrovimonas sp.]
ATVDILTDKRTQTLGVPISSVVVKTDTSCTKSFVKKDDKVESQEKEKYECVFVKVGDEAKLRVIKTGIQDDSNIEVISGLNENDEIITGPYNMVSRTLDNCDKVKAKGSNESKKDSEEAKE